MFSKKESKMELAIGTEIRYTSAAGTRKAIVENIKVGPTAKAGFLNTWITLRIPVQPGVKFANSVNIPGDSASIKGFRVEVL
jgi:hypothetical protein